MVSPHMEKARLPEEKRKPVQGSAGVCLLSAKVHARLLLSIMRTSFLRALDAQLESRFIISTVGKCSHL